MKRGGREESDLKYWYVSVHHKTDIRNDLARLGISESSLFPGLASLASQIREEFVLGRTDAERNKARSSGMKPEVIANTKPTEPS